MLSSAYDQIPHLASPGFAPGEAEVVGSVPLGRYETGQKFYHVFRLEDGGGYQAVWGVGKTAMGQRAFGSTAETEKALKDKATRGYVFVEGYFSHPGHRLRE